MPALAPADRYDEVGDDDDVPDPPEMDGPVGIAADVVLARELVAVLDEVEEVLVAVAAVCLDGVWPGPKDMVCPRAVGKLARADRLVTA